MMESGTGLPFRPGRKGVRATWVPREPGAPAPQSGIVVAGFQRAPAGDEQGQKARLQLPGEAARVGGGRLAPEEPSSLRRSQVGGRQLRLCSG